MIDDNIIGIDGRQSAQLRADQGRAREAGGNTQTEIEVRRT
jgi:hypothetical protein